jgi:hypothetical protein
VLLGSGVSTGAGIPTGWEIVLELIRRLAQASGEAPPTSEEAWYVEQFGEEPTYSGLLARLGRTAAEREAIIRSLIEPSEDVPGRRPTPAHHALAHLAQIGLIRAFLTTNFDRLLEEAFSEASVVPSVWSTAEAVAGGLPLVHSGVVLVKLHGDYLDPGIKNTPAELDTYQPAVDRLLDEIFANYGLLVCGWSTEYDTALRRALERGRTHRFTCWWTSCSGLTDGAGRLASHCSAEIVPIENADDYFGRLGDACDVLRDLNRRRPATIEVAVASAKRELDGQRRAVSVHDSLRAELQRIADLPLYTPSRDYPATEHEQRLEAVAAEVELVVALVAVTAYWGNEATDDWWFGDIERLGRYVLGSGGMHAFGLPRVPGLAVMWAGGVAATAARRYETVARLLTEPKSVPAFSTTLQLVPAGVSLLPDVLHIGQDARWVFRLLRRTIAEHVGIGLESYVAAWEKWQLILLAGARDFRDTHDTPIGTFVPYMRVDCPLPLDGYSLPVAAALRTDLLRAGETNPVLSHGLFGGDPDRLEAAIDHTVDELLERARAIDQGLITSTPGGFSGVPSGLHFPGARGPRPDTSPLPGP